ncbi:MAG: Perillic acid-CoA ligase GeoC [Nevskia sp.]|nr:Perillic acid-CoA ligase GeoC [Nevskia sp.]
MWLHAEIKSLADIPRYYARTLPDKIALIDGVGGRTFRQLDRTSNLIGAALVAAGVPRCSHIGFIGKNSARYFEALFGATKAACAITPLNWRLTETELALVIEDARCPIIFVDKEFSSVAKNLQGSCTHKFRCIQFDSTSTAADEFEDWLGTGEPVDPAIECSAEDTAVLIYTSGTTGKPKGVQLTHRGFGYMRLCEHLEPALQWQADDVMLMVMPNFHLVGTGLSVQSLYNGSTVSILPALDPGRTLKLIERDRPTICALVPTAIQMLLDHPDAATADFSSLRLVMYAGSPISSRLLQRAIAEMKCRFMQFYGATESSGAITLLRPEQHDIDNEARLRSCGTPLPLIEIKIVDAEGKELPQGATGEFMVRSPSLFGGYWNQPDATAAVLQGGWYRTGDAGFRDAEGLLYIVDRVKDMIVTGGENVYSGEVEQALQKHPAVRLSTVIGVPDERWGEKVTAVVIVAEGATLTADEVISHCRTLIAGYKVPKTVRFVDVLPMTATGKVLKRAVRDQFLKDVENVVG